MMNQSSHVRLRTRAKRLIRRPTTKTVVRIMVVRVTVKMESPREVALEEEASAIEVYVWDRDVRVARVQVIVFAVCEM